MSTKSLTNPVTDFFHSSAALVGVGRASKASLTDWYEDLFRFPSMKADLYSFRSIGWLSLSRSF